MKARRTKALVVAGALAGALGLTAMGAGTASADSPRSGLTFRTFGECLTYGNVMAQKGLLHGYSCPQEVDGLYHFYWNP
jgi:hypothetical protein